MKVQSVDIFHCSIIGARRDWSSTVLSFNRPLLMLSFNSPLSLSPAHLYAALSVSVWASFKKHKAFNCEV